MPSLRRTLSIAVLGLAASACGGVAASPSPPPSQAVSGDPVALVITAKDIALTPATMDVPAGQPLQIQFDNKDAGVPHDLVLKAGPGFTTELAKTDIAVGPATSTLTVPGLVPGTYQFTCQVHPNMTANLTVGG